MIINRVYVNNYNIQDIKQIFIIYFLWAFCPLAGARRPNGRIDTNNYILVIIFFCNTYTFSQR